MLTIIVTTSFILALLITFLNGMNDSANSISTVIVTHVLSPKKAVLWAVLWEMMAFFLLKFSVAETMGTGIAHETYMTPYVVFSALLGALIWLALCTWKGMPISTSQALIGGIIGSVWFVYGNEALVGTDIFLILAFIVIAPLLGLIVGFFLMCIIMKLCKNMKKRTVDTLFRRLQLASSAAFSIGHGANDAQKTMGIIAIMMFMTLQNQEVSDNLRSIINVFYDQSKGFYIPDNLAILCYLIMALGIIVGGKRVIKTIGQDIARIDPARGFCAETSGALTLIISSVFGIPVSSSHTISGSIIGVGLTSGMKSVHWDTAKRIVIAWIWTIPAPLIISGIINLLINNYLN